MAQMVPVFRRCLGGAECGCCGAARPIQQSAPTAAGAEVLCIDDDSGSDSEYARQHLPEACTHNGSRPSGQAQQQQGLYVLDCGCRGTVNDLSAHLQRQLKQHAGADLQHTVESLACSRCCKLISNSDAYKLLGAADVSEAYAALVDLVQQSYEASGSSASAPSCVQCPAGTQVLPVAALTKARSGGSPGLPSKQLLQSCLKVRHLPVPRQAADCAAELASHLQADCMWFCSGCTSTWPSNGISRSSGTEVSAATSQALQLWDQLVLLQKAMLDTGSAGNSSRAAGQGSSSKGSKGGKGKGKHDGSNNGSAAWAAGTGYGGSAGCLNTAAHKHMTEAAQRQAQVDAAVQLHLSNIANIICRLPVVATTPPAATAGQTTISSAAAVCRKRKRNRPEPDDDIVAVSPAAAAPTGTPVAPATGRAAVAAPPSLVTCAVLLAGPLAWLLRLLMSNDSMMDVGGRQELYREVMRLARLIGSSSDLLPLLQLPAEDPRDTSTPAAGSSSSITATTLLAALMRLDQQAKLFRKSAQELMQEDGDDDTVAAVCLALDLSSLVEDISHANAMFNATLVAEKGAIQLQPISAVAAAAPSTAAAASRAAAAAVGRTPRQGSGRQPSRSTAEPSPATATAATPTNAAGSAAADLESRYMNALRPLQFGEANLLKVGGSSAHYFKSMAGKQPAAGGEMMRKRLRRITEELGSLSTSLPLSADSSVLLAVDAERMDVLRALLLPHPDTPYGCGAFLFDILLPENYPDKPPLVQFLTTGGGRVRFNPNLYNNGKVCLSLLGTWSGPSWEPGVSTLLQVLVSLQSMVFVPDPYFNEPGYETTAKSASGKQRSKEYNQDLRLQTARHAILDALVSPDPAFKQALQLHFALKTDVILGMLNNWVTEAGKEKRQLQDVVQQIKLQLQRLKPPAVAAESGAAAAAMAVAPDVPVQQGARTSSHRSGSTNGVHCGDAAVAGLPVTTAAATGNVGGSKACRTLTDDVIDLT